MIAIAAIPALPILIRIGTHAAAAVAGAVVYAHREHLPGFSSAGHRRGGGAHVLPFRSDVASHAQLHAEVRALHGQVQQGLDALRAESREVTTVLPRLSARQDALEHLLAARSAATGGESGDGEARSSRRDLRAQESRATP